MQALKFPLGFQVRAAHLVLGYGLFLSTLPHCCAFAAMIQQTPEDPYNPWH